MIYYIPGRILNAYTMLEYTEWYLVYHTTRPTHQP